MAISSFEENGGLIYMVNEQFPCRHCMYSEISGGCVVGGKEETSLGKTPTGRCVAFIPSTDYEHLYVE